MYWSRLLYACTHFYFNSRRSSSAMIVSPDFNEPGCLTVDWRRRRLVHGGVGWGSSPPVGRFRLGSPEPYHTQIKYWLSQRTPLWLRSSRSGYETLPITVSCS